MYYFRRNPAKTSGLIDNITQIAATVLPFISGGSGQNASSGGQAKGLAAITNAVNTILQNLQQLAQTPNAQTLAQAQELRAVLDNHSVIYQAKKGKDAEVLNKGKAAADVIILQMRNAVSSMTQNTGNTQVVTLPNGQTVTLPQENTENQIINGLDNKYLYGIAGITTIYFLTRR